MPKPRTIPSAATAAEPSGDALPAVARAAIAEHLSGKPSKVPLPKASGYLADKRGVFVTLRDKHGDIRGRAGSPEPEGANLVEETRRQAVAAACSSPGLDPVKSTRALNQLTIEVSVLGAPERVESIIELDPEIYGVVLTAAKTGTRGVMLPREPGLGTVDKQLAAIRRQAGLRPDERLKIERFRAETFSG